LVYHQKHAKYCVSKRSETTPEYPCEYCGKVLGSKYILNNHLSICPIKKRRDYKSEIKALKKKYESKLFESEKKNKTLERKNGCLTERITELEGKLQERDGYIDGLKTAPEKKTIYNTAIHPKLVNLPINNIPALTDEYIMEKINDGILTYEKASRGYPGILDVICEMITHENTEGEIERNYVCTDVSRNSFHRLLESKKWKSDKGGRYLNNILDTFRSDMEEYKNRAYETYNVTPHERWNYG
jgi:hypothetical protein